MLNTATVLGVGVNLHGAGFPREYLSPVSAKAAPPQASPMSQ